MLSFPVRFAFAVLAISSISSAHAIEIRSYSAAAHDRFDNFQSSPTKNPDQLFGTLDLTGIGWYSASQDIQFALVSRQHVIFATHFADAIGTNSPIRFLNGANEVISRTGPTRTVIADPDTGEPSDLVLITLSSPIDEDAGIAPLPYLDTTIYTGLPLGVAGKRNVSGNRFPVIAKGTIGTVESSPRTVPTTMLNPTRYMQFTYSFVGAPDDCYFEIGDSGSPSFVETNGRAALVGTHTYVIGVGSSFQNYDAFVPHYVPDLDSRMAALGYRMRPVNAPTTTLSGIASAAVPTPRQAHPLSIEFMIENTGANLTGNLEVEFTFPSGQEPDSVTATGWVSHGSGSKWTLRRATLESSASDTLTASWASAPITAALTPTITWRSDTVADQSISPSFTLLPSYAAWAMGLAEGGLADDPDDDHLVNQMEYALGGDPEDGAAVLPNGDRLLPTISVSGDVVTYSYPERSDKAARGLSYEPEWSDGLTAYSFSATPPAGLGSTTAAYDPDLPGFVKRSISWPLSAPRQFVRLGVRLDE